jgi:hypothetical protein
MELPVGKRRRLVIGLTSPETAGPPPETDRVAHPEAERQDLVRKHSRKVAFGLAVLAVGLLVGSLDYGVREGLPSIALDWLFGLQVVRAALVFAIVAVLLMLIVRGWGGMWPESFLTTGLGYPAEKSVESGIAATTATSRELAALLTAEMQE